MSAPAIALPTIAEPSKVCRGQCRTLKVLSDYGKNGHGGLFAVCRSCRSKQEWGKQQAHRKKKGVRQCDTCKQNKPIGPEGAFEYDGKHHTYSKTCIPCKAWLLATIDPLVEAEDDLRKGIRTRQRWALTLVVMMERRGIDLAGYKALRGDKRVAFEREWSEAMKLACRAETDAAATKDQLHEAALHNRPRTLAGEVAPDTRPEPTPVQSFPWPKIESEIEHEMAREAA